MFKNTCVSRNLKSILSWYETYLWRAGQDRIFFLGMLTQQICNLQERAFSNFIQRLEIQDEPSSPAVPVFCLHLQETKVLYTRVHVNYTAYIHLLAQEVRHRVKSPAKRAKPITNSGIGTLPNGTKFIKYWPSDRKPADLRTCPRQSLKEAAKWCKEVPTHSRPVRWNLNTPTSLLNSDFVFIYFKGGSTQCSTNSFWNEYFTDLYCTFSMEPNGLCYPSNLPFALSPTGPQESSGVCSQAWRRFCVGQWKRTANDFRFYRVPGFKQMGW